MKKNDTCYLNSTCISSASYDDANAVMFVNFVNGRKYRYSSVPRAVYEGLVNADSVGKEFNASIRGQYDYQQL